MKRTPALLCLALGLAQCSPTPPTISLDVKQGAGAPDVVGLSRLELIVRTCGANEALLDADLDVRAEALDPVSLDIVPGTELYVHLKGWVDCAGSSCTPPDRAGLDDCVCPDKSGDPPRILRAEGCSDWFSAEQDRPVTITLGDRLGLCPPPLTSCGQ